ncbi:CGNR zinc finger domain-containing protein [Allosalinactinospora lopnorensis]|uniref:CGNR zinc finger domain-containing protein n=1 Tax=Allosalinactinospora lopnorensis TaxID=1352348 RepID=UPI000623C5EC|nr:CGNR zinc finger domain-containing protein [Allosalinactinospora lopnorensis]
MTYDRPTAPGPLDEIEAFCNSARFLYGEESLSDVAGARAWLRGQGYPEAAAELDEATRQDLVAVREAIRDHVSGSGRERDRARGLLNDYAEGTLSAPRWSAGGRPEIPVADTDPVHALIGRMLGVLAAEELAGRRDRLKACRSAECRWLYYDRSAANNSVWCSMSICGARHKMRSYRSRRRGGS